LDSRKVKITALLLSLFGTGIRVAANQSLKPSPFRVVF
jgi:hypothetical protein